MAKPTTVKIRLVSSEGTGFFYTGTYLGTKRVAAVGAAFDAQAEYRAFAGDAFLDYPSGPGAVTAQFAYNRFDGGATFMTLPRFGWEALSPTSNSTSCGRLKATKHCR